MSRPPALAVALCLLAVTAGPATAAPAAVFELGQQFDRTQFRITVHANGTAEWTFHYERTLANQSQVEQFEAYAAGFTANETQLFRDFRNQSRALIDRAEAATDRSMTATGFGRRAFVTTGLNDVGVVEMSFTWTGFGRVDGDRVVVGDVFEGGLYVGPNQALVVRAADGLAFGQVEPAGTLSSGTLASSDTVTWSGERRFADNHPRVVLVPESSVTTADRTSVGPTTGGPPNTATAVTDQGAPVWPVALVLALVLGAIGAFLYRRRSGGPTGAGPGSPSAPFDETALMEDEERITGLLEEHGGRMRQSDIVEATGWSKSKVSMVLSEMTEADQIRKLRVGRENIISLPGHEPNAARRRDEGE